MAAHTQSIIGSCDSGARPSPLLRGEAGVTKQAADKEQDAALASSLMFWFFHGAALALHN